MEKGLKNHVRNCRCCFNSLSHRRRKKITKTFRDNFLKFVGIEASIISFLIIVDLYMKNFLLQLQESPSFSSFVCAFCNDKIENMAKNCETFLRNQKLLHEYVRGKVENSVTPFIPKPELEYDEVTMDPFEVIGTNLEEVLVKVENFVEESCVSDDRNDSIDLEKHKFPIKPCFVNLERISSSGSDSKSRSHEINFNDFFLREPTELENLNKKLLCTKCGAVSETKRKHENHLKEQKVGRKRGTDDFDEDIPKPCPFCGKMLRPRARAQHVS